MANKQEAELSTDAWLIHANNSCRLDPPLERFPFSRCIPFQMHILQCSPPASVQDGAAEVPVRAGSEEGASTTPASSSSPSGGGGGGSGSDGGVRAAASRDCEEAASGSAAWSWTREDVPITHQTFPSGAAALPRSPPRLTPTASTVATPAPPAGRSPRRRPQTELSNAVAQTTAAVPPDRVRIPALAEHHPAVASASVPRLALDVAPRRPIGDTAFRAAAAADEFATTTLAERREVPPPLLPEDDDDDNGFPEGKEHRFCVLPTVPVPVDPHVETVSHLLSQLDHWETSSPDDADATAQSNALAETLQVLGDWCGRLPDWSDACQQLLKVQVPSRTLKVMERLVARMQQQQPQQPQLQLQPPLGPSNDAGGSSGSNPPHGHDRDTLLQGCYVLANLCYRAGAEAQSRIGDLGGVEVLIQVLQVQPPCFDNNDDDDNNNNNNSDDDDDTALLQQFACGALGNLIRMGHIDNARRLVRAGGVELVIQAMEHHRHALELQEWAFRALHNVCHWNDFRAHVVNAGGVTAIEAARQNHANKDNGSEETNHASHDHFHRQTEWAMAVLVETAQSSPQ